LTPSQYKNPSVPRYMPTPWPASATYSGAICAGLAAAAEQITPYFNPVDLFICFLDAEGLIVGDA